MSRLRPIRFRPPAPAGWAEATDAVAPFAAAPPPGAPGPPPPGATPAGSLGEIGIGLSEGRGGATRCPMPGPSRRWPPRGRPSTTSRPAARCAKTPDATTRRPGR
jgi:hypothetical protein